MFSRTETCPRRRQKCFLTGDSLPKMSPTVLAECCTVTDKLHFPEMFAISILRNHIQIIRNVRFLSFEELGKSCTASLLTDGLLFECSTFANSS